MSVFKINEKSHLEKHMFFDESVDIQRFESVKYPALEKLTEQQKSFFWTPEEVDVTRDKIDFSGLSDNEKHIFTSNLKRQILLDSVQGRGPNLMLLPYASLPELENFIETWAFFEGAIHSRSYTHIIRNVYPNPSEVFDTMLDIPEITSCAADIAKYYDDLDVAGTYYKMLGLGTHIINGETVEVSEYELKKKLWLCLNSINVLEGIRFYVSFACSWAFAENKLMEGNAKIIRLICRDENLHLAATQMILRLLKKEDPDFAKIAEECHEEVQTMFMDAIRQEEEWADYLFKDGSIIGLNAQILKDYIRWIGSKRMIAVGVKCPFSVSKNNPLPWTVEWISSADVQVAPQETEISSYIIGGITNDIEENDFSDYDL
ncbi:ribonucleotide reductase of class Ia, beta subunit [Salmonella phage SE_PL]|uniref:class Ia ribonucleoside-diphosphate reductase subunit beta n=1 Tax=Salmonella enterica TaxID=28901 RepID=UPI000FDF7DF7|nr:ribonucleotide reductase [Salmonella phage Munch]EAZ2022624.1 ribonucleotide-diphosphate reductase subunit beta [Salmonella enterica]ECV9083758.1 ribonucleotide-diphosphate reductase subunit beta [Salmonella enterica subsp. enterica serovar Infantis]MCP0435651.1 ribonucleotide-diphosphate reductase subunit beta [Salmonella enterica subsp. enterica serovar Mbandaka]QCW19027.1 ribonucleotide-diphosphate reductase subunit beta [Salmonella phage 7t3]QIG62710.1 ribonucleotide reductase of class 